MKKILTLFIIILLSTLSFCQEIKTEDWTTDLNFLKSELQKKHINLFFKLTKNEFEEGIEEIISKLDSDSDFETTMKLSQLLAKIGDSHTTINISKFLNIQKNIPINCTWFGEDIHVVSTSKDNYEILDKKMVSINEYHIKTIIDSIKTIFSNDNNATIKKGTIRLINNKKLLDYFGFSKSSDSIYRIGFENSKNQLSFENVATERYDKKTRISTKIDGLRPYYIEGKGNIFKEKYYEKDKIYYIQYNKCISKESVLATGNKLEATKYPSYKKFEQKILNTIETKKVKKLIFDMRFNTGGNSSIIKNLIRQIRVNKSLNQKDKLFVVVGQRTYSSAILNTLAFKHFTNATVIGEETSGMPNHYGNIKSFYLPYSNIKLNYSTKYHNLYKGIDNTIKPDIEIIRTFDDYKKGIDPIYEFVKNY
ncbi:S41 family peptidase [Psychroserpens ponticola]|uniref:S41 family peptidase n=1 Tax=Psychroserpens ponticola TaxID=2932268 RepID=A0ABY7S266_9FLAO|nr:S41 family peptidase [Psychroserpens ponticola]WCO03491.1 S41 family peptidase [Psychroserpens ponticola]